MKELLRGKRLRVKKSCESRKSQRVFTCKKKKGLPSVLVTYKESMISTNDFTSPSVISKLLHDFGGVFPEDNP